jgi:hypothetical protein
MTNALSDFLNENGITQADAARELGLSIPQFNRIMRGHVPAGWSLVGRMCFYWHHSKNLPGVENVITAIGNQIHNRESTS